MKVANFANEHDIPMGYNLSAVFLLQFELNNVLPALECADYVFANEDEAAEFAKTQGMEGADLKDVAKCLAKWKKTNTKRPRVAIVTYGAKPVIVAINTPGSDDVELTEYPITPLESS
jgi:adenosine kinase